MALRLSNLFGLGAEARGTEMSNDELFAAWKRKLPSVEPTDRELTAFALGVEVGQADAAKSERRAVAFGDIVNSQILAMRAAVVAAKLEGLDVGMQWIANTLCGPGHLPDIDEARALGGAQALWDKETAEHEALRAAHPAP